MTKIIDTPITFAKDPSSPFRRDVACALKRKTCSDETIAITINRNHRLSLRLFILRIVPFYSNCKLNRLSKQAYFFDQFCMRTLFRVCMFRELPQNTFNTLVSPLNYNKCL